MDEGVRVVLQGKRGLLLQSIAQELDWQILLFFKSWVGLDYSDKLDLRTLDQVFGFTVHLLELYMATMLGCDLLQEEGPVTTASL